MPENTRSTVKKPLEPPVYKTHELFETQLQESLKFISNPSNFEKLSNKEIKKIFEDAEKNIQDYIKISNPLEAIKLQEISRNIKKDYNSLIIFNELGEIIKKALIFSPNENLTTKINSAIETCLKQKTQLSEKYLAALDDRITEAKKISLEKLKNTILGVFTKKNSKGITNFVDIDKETVKKINSTLETCLNIFKDLSEEQRNIAKTYITEKEEGLFSHITSSLEKMHNEAVDVESLNKMIALIENTSEIDFFSESARTKKQEIIKKYQGILTSEKSSKIKDFVLRANRLKKKLPLDSTIRDQLSIALDNRIKKLRDDSFQGNYHDGMLANLPEEGNFSSCVSDAAKAVEDDIEKYSIRNSTQIQDLLNEKFAERNQLWKLFQKNGKKKSGVLDAPTPLVSLEYRKKLYEFRMKNNPDDETAVKKLTATKEMIAYVNNIKQAVGNDGRITVEGLEKIKKPEHWKSPEAENGELGKLRKCVKAFRDGLHYKEIQEAKAAVKIAKENLRNWQKVKSVNTTELELKLIQAELKELIAGYKQTIDLHSERDKYTVRFFWNDSLGVKKKLAFTAKTKLNEALVLLGKTEEGFNNKETKIILDKKNETTSDRRLGKIYDKLARLTKSTAPASASTP